MGFFESVGRAIGKKMGDSMREFAHYKEMYRDYDEEELYEEYRRSYGMRKRACAYWLKRRREGYDGDDDYDYGNMRSRSRSYYNDYDDDDD